MISVFYVNNITLCNRDGHGSKFAGPNPTQPVISVTQRNPIQSIDGPDHVHLCFVDRWFSLRRADRRDIHVSFITYKIYLSTAFVFE